MLEIWIVGAIVVVLGVFGYLNFCLARKSARELQKAIVAGRIGATQGVATSVDNCGGG
jgi:hypothetical protein